MLPKKWAHFVSFSVKILQNSAVAQHAFAAHLLIYCLPRWLTQPQSLIKKLEEHCSHLLCYPKQTTIHHGFRLLLCQLACTRKLRG